MNEYRRRAILLAVLYPYIVFHGEEWQACLGAGNDGVLLARALGFSEDEIQATR